MSDSRIKSREPELAAGEAVEVTTVRAFSDNYLWLVHGHKDRRRVAVVDPGDAEAIERALTADALQLDAILVTHHHPDHVGGVAALAQRHGVPVYGPAGEEIPARTRALKDGDSVVLGALGLTFDVWDVPGHTAGHIAYVGHGAVFCGDTLFSAGCGRLFEGTAAQMNASLGRLAALPESTRVYCAHEYTASNLRFALAVDPDNAAAVDYTRRVTELRARDEATIPTTIGLERQVNPFLRANLPALRAAAERRAGRSLSTPTEVFAVVREWKNEFR
jgi:hydroxyacylglutathione hydrolase